MKLLVDAQLPPALARQLVALGQDAVAAPEVGLHAADDSQIWQYALDAKTEVRTHRIECSRLPAR